MQQDLKKSQKQCWHRVFANKKIEKKVLPQRSSWISVGVFVFTLFLGKINLSCDETEQCDKMKLEM